MKKFILTLTILLMSTISFSQVYSEISSTDLKVQRDFFLSSYTINPNVETIKVNYYLRQQMLEDDTLVVKTDIMRYKPTYNRLDTLFRFRTDVVGDTIQIDTAYLKQVYDQPTPTRIGLLIRAINKGYIRKSD